MNGPPPSPRDPAAARARELAEQVERAGDARRRADRDLDGAERLGLASGKRPGPGHEERSRRWPRADGDGVDHLDGLGGEGAASRTKRTEDSR